VLPRPTRKIGVIDDDVSILRALRLSLEVAGFEGARAIRREHLLK